jgi:hypothetical protein
MVLTFNIWTFNHTWRQGLYPGVWELCIKCMGPGNNISLHVGVSCISLAVQVRSKEMEVTDPTLPTALAWLRRCSWEVKNRPPYSPHLASSDFLRKQDVFTKTKFYFSINLISHLNFMHLCERIYAMERRAAWELIKEFLEYYETHRFITAFVGSLTIVSVLSQTNRIRSSHRTS